jgi:hypothetical protein
MVSGPAKNLPESGRALTIASGRRHVDEAVIVAIVAAIIAAIVV